MKLNRPLALILVSILLVSLAACSKNADSLATDSFAENEKNSADSTSEIIPQGTPQDEKGTISNPYSINDVIMFTTYNSFTKEELCTVNIHDMAFRDDIDITGYAPGQSRWFITFSLEVIKSYTDEPIRPYFDMSIDFGNINTNGISGDCDWLPRGLNTYTDVTDYKDLEILPGFSANVGCVLVNESGGDLYLITLKYHNKNGEPQNIYINPNI